LRYRDKNGVDHECLGEAFATKYNVFLLIYPTKTLSSSSIFVPATVNIIQPGR
jgi:hypothetical protein